MVPSKHVVVLLGMLTCTCGKRRRPATLRGKRRRGAHAPRWPKKLAGKREDALTVFEWLGGLLALALGGLALNRSIANRIAEVKADVARLKIDVAQLKTDIAELKAISGRNEVDMGQLKSTVDGLDEFKSDVSQLKTGVARLEAEVAAVRVESDRAHAAIGRSIRESEERVMATLGRRIDDMKDFMGERVCDLHQVTSERIRDLKDVLLREHSSN